MQGVQLASTDGTVFLVAQPDGNLVLYNASLVQSVYGMTPAAAIWYSGSAGTVSPAPYTLLMQEVSALHARVHKGKLQQYGPCRPWPRTSRSTG